MLRLRAAAIALATRGRLRSPKLFLSAVALAEEEAEAIALAKAGGVGGEVMSDLSRESGFIPSAVEESESRRASRGERVEESESRDLFALIRRYPNKEQGSQIFRRGT